jgi:hypothetical protein
VVESDAGETVREVYYVSHRIGNNVVICSESEAKCELCGKVSELRPYGPRGENICFECGMKNLKTTERQLARVLFGEEVQ